jgi:hypothetical protein
MKSEVRTKVHRTQPAIVNNPSIST